MTRRISSLMSVAAALLIPALSGCAFLHKSEPAPVPLLAQAPTVEQPPLAPLYTELSQNDPPLPELPTPPAPGAQPTPPPASIIVDKKPVHLTHRRGRKGETELAEREAREREAHEKEVPAPESVPTEGQNVKVTAPTPTGDTTAPTPIGQLTAGPTQDLNGSRQQAASLIDTTQRGVDSLHKLNGDQYKTAAQIRSFLQQAERALHNGDVDGAHTLATKAKTLLDELTGAS